MDQASKGSAALSVQDRIRGCLLGGAIGDALGGPVEFWSYSDIHERCGDRGVRDFLPATYGSTRGVGLITDDTQMTLFTVEGIIRAVIRIKARGIGRVHGPMQHAYQRWYTTQTFMAPPEVTDEQDPNFVDGWLGHQQWLYSQRAPGNTCMTALASLRGGSFGATASNDSKGCGTVMRSAPFGFMDTEDCGWIAVECSEITHGHEAASASAGALAVLIKGISRGATRPSRSGALSTDERRTVFRAVTYSGFYEANPRSHILRHSRPSCRRDGTCIPRTRTRSQPLRGEAAGLGDIAECSPFGERVLLIGGTPGGVGRWVGKSSAAAGGDVSAMGHGCCVEERESRTRCFRLVDPR